MSGHYTEVFRDDSGVWGWQCFDRDCEQEGISFDDFESAEAAANRHALEAP